MKWNSSGLDLSRSHLSAKIISLTGQPTVLLPLAGCNRYTEHEPCPRISILDGSCTPNHCGRTVLPRSVVPSFCRTADYKSQA